MAKEVKKIRSKKNSIEFFLMPINDTPVISNIKFELGMAGYGILGALHAFMLSDSENGFYQHWDKTSKRIIARDCFLSPEELDKIIDVFAEEGAIDKELLINHDIITSAWVQKNWVMTAKERSKFLECVNFDYLLIDISEDLTYNEKKFEYLRNKNKKEEKSSEVQIIPISENNSEIEETGDVNEGRFDEKTGGVFVEIHDMSTDNDNVGNKTTKQSKKQSKAKQSEANIPFFDSSNQNTSKEVGLETMPVLEIENKAIRDIEPNSAIANFEQEQATTEPMAENNQKAEISQKTAIDKKAKKQPHPARAEFIRIWEQNTDLLFVADMDSNVSISNLLKKFEGFVRNKIEKKEIAQNDKPIEFHMVQLYQKMWENCSQLNDWQNSKFITWIPFNKNFDDIVLAFNRIWKTDKPKIVKMELNKSPQFQYNRL